MPATQSSSREAEINFPSDVHWRHRLRLPLKMAAQIAGVSPASLYKFEREGKLIFRRLGGRTVVETASLIALIENDDEWTPSTRGSVARALRSERSRKAWGNNA